MATVTCECRFISSNKRASQVGNAGNGGDCACVKEGGMWEISAPSQFCSEPKTALKIKSIFKKYKV